MKRGTTPQTVDTRAFQISTALVPILGPAYRGMSAEGAGLEPDPVVDRVERVSTA